MNQQIFEVCRNLADTTAQARCVSRLWAILPGRWCRRCTTVRRCALQASKRQSRELQAEWQHKYMSIQGESAIMKHELDDVRLLSSSRVMRTSRCRNSEEAYHV